MSKNKAGIQHFVQSEQQFLKLTHKKDMTYTLDKKG